MEKLKLLLASRKFWAAVIGLTLVIVRAYAPDFPVKEDELAPLVALIAAFILGTGLEDGLARRPAPGAGGQNREG